MALEAFAVEFAKLVAIQEDVQINKDIVAKIDVEGNSAIADVKAEATALGFNSHTETLGLTSTTAVEGVGSTSSSIAESVAAAQPNDIFHM